MMGIELALRIYYQAMTGSKMCGDVGVSKWATRRRARGQLDKESYQTIAAACEQGAPYSKQYLDDLAGVARNVIAAVLASATA